MLELATLISRHARRRPTHTAFIFEGERYTWESFAARVAQAAHALRGLGVRKGERVATVLGNCRELMEIYWACPTLGAVLVPLSPLLQESGLASLLSDAAPYCVITSSAHAARVEAAISLAGGARPRVVVTDGNAAFPDCVDYQTATAQASSAITPEPCTPDDLYNIMYTSGTTGLPKGIMHTHFVRSMYALMMAPALRMTPESVVVQTGSLVFNGAFLMLMPSFFNGGTYVLTRQFDAEQLIELIERERATHIGVVPSQLIALLSARSFDPRRLQTLECIISFGAPLLQSYKEELQRVLPDRLYELYGLTEGFATLLDRSDAVRKPGSVGAPLAFSEMRILRDDGTPCATGEVGEIVGRGPWLMSGYYKRPDLTAAAVREGWLYSGDLGRIDGDGFLYLIDRKKEMIDSGGMKVYPKDVEEVAARHPAVRDVAVFGAPHDHWGETPIAAVILSAEDAVTAQELREWINERVAAKYQRVSQVVIMKEFPRNVAGKTLKRELREPYWRATGRSI